jgi:hypothetical protein
VFSINLDVRDIILKDSGYIDLDQLERKRLTMYLWKGAFGEDAKVEISG